MKLHLSEKQLTNLLQLLSEDGASPSATPSGDTTATGASSKQTGGSGYPAVGKWESGLQRGAANQIAVTKWADVVGAKMSRGKANQLKEQYTQVAFNSMVKARQDENQKQADFEAKHYILPIPNDLYLIIPRAVRNIKTTYLLWGDDAAEKNKAFFNIYFTNPDYKRHDEIVPRGDEINSIVPSGTLRSFTVNGIWFRMQLVYKDRSWKFMGYYDKNDHPYQQDMYINPADLPDAYKKDGFWKEWNNAILLTLGLVAAFVIPGAAGLWIGLGLDLTAVATSMYYGDNVGAALGIVASFLPFIGPALKIGQVSTSQARRIMNSLQYAKTEEELLALINGVSRTPGGRLLTQQDRYILKTLHNLPPKEISNSIKNVIKQNAKVIKTTEALERGEKMNDIISTVKKLAQEGKVSNSNATSFLRTYGIETAAFIGGSIIGLGIIGEMFEALQKYFDIMKGDPNAHDEDYLRFIELQKIWADLEPQIQENERADLENKLIPLNKHFNFIVENRYENDDQGKGTKGIIGLSILLAMVRAYILDPNTNLEVIGNKQLEIERKKYEDREK